MKFIKNILVTSMLLFFIGCTAWPALIPPPAGKTKTAIYPIPLPATTTSSIPAIRITAPPVNTVYGKYTLPYSSTLQLGAIGKDDAIITSAIIEWKSSDTNIATVSATGLVTSLTKDGTTTITATHPTLTPAGTLEIIVNAAGKSVLAFDGKDFIELSSKPTNKISEEK